MSNKLLLKTHSEIFIPVAEYFKVLSETSRLQILSCLKQGEMNVTELSQATGLGQANLSKHLKVLTQAGILNRQPQGVSAYYSVNDPMIFELCDLVCQRISERMHEQAESLEKITFFSNQFLK